MKLSQTENVLLVLLTSLMVAAIAYHGSIQAATLPQPREFSVAYSWRAATVPPPYHYEYDITINSRGEGKIIMVPDYPSETVPRWMETFTLEDKEIGKLYALMIDNGLLTRAWKPLDRQPIGDSRQYLTINAGGKVFHIQSTMNTDDQRAADAIYSAVTSTVPKTIWDKLNSQRVDYMEKHRRR